MPNLGLKPNEVKAVVDYVPEQVKKNVEKQGQEFANYTLPIELLTSVDLLAGKIY